jgi:hypothetical protein
LCHELSIIAAALKLKRIILTHLVVESNEGWYEGVLVEGAMSQPAVYFDKEEIHHERLIIV